VINVGEHAGALVLASNEERSGTEVEIHPVSRPGARTHVWVLPREGRDGVVYAAIFPSLESGDYAILNVDGSIADVVSVPPNQVTHATLGVVRIGGPHRGGLLRRTRPQYDAH
jgi:hypothetical protein